MTIPALTATEVGLPALQALAYSQEAPGAAPEPVPHRRYPWDWVAARAALFVVLAVVLAGGIIVLGFLPPTELGLPTEPSGMPVVSAPPVEAPTVTPPPPLVVPPDVNPKLAGDAWYLSMVNSGLAPIGMSVSGPASIISDGHHICGYITQGHSVDQTIDEAVSGMPAILSASRARTVAVVVVGAAVLAYCPQPEQRWL